MPNVLVLQEDLFRYLGRSFSKSSLASSSLANEEFEDLCFAFGLEIEIGTGAQLNLQRINRDGASENLT